MTPAPISEIRKSCKEMKQFFNDAAAHSDDPQQKRMLKAVSDLSELVEELAAHQEKTAKQLRL